MSNRFKTTLAMIFATAVVAGVAFAQSETFRSNVLRFGIGSSSDDKVVEFDTGDGAANKKITVDEATKSGTFNVDTFRIGDGTTTNDKIVEADNGNSANNPKVFYDESDAAWKFTNDGSRIQAIGSGAGGGSGVNLLAESNFDFEGGDPPTDWVNTGAAFSAETVEPLFGSQSGLWDASAPAQTLISATVPVTAGFIGQSCQAEASYKWTGAQGEVLVRVRNSTITLVEQELIATTGSDVGQIQLQFDCPSVVGETLVFELASTADSLPVTIDQVFLGTGRNTLNISQSEVWLEAIIPATGGCSWNFGSTGLPALPGPDPQCPDAQGVAGAGSSNVDGLATANLPRIAVNEVPAGQYFVSLNSGGSWEGNTNNQTAPVCSLVETITGKTLDTQVQVKPSGTSLEAMMFTFKGTLFLASQQNLNFELLCSEAGSNGIRLDLDFSTQSADFRLVMLRNPLKGSPAITLNTSGFFAEGNIFGTTGGSPALQTGDVADADGDTLTRSDMAIQQITGGLRIACDGAAAVGTTCSGVDELVGIDFDAPSPGTYKVCSRFSHNVQVGGTSGSRVETTFFLRHTDATGATVLKAPVNRASGTVLYTGSPQAANRETPFTICEFFQFGDVGAKRVDLAYNQNITNTAAGLNFLRADNNPGVLGSRSIYFSVEKITEQKPTPVFTDLQNDFAARPSVTASNVRIVNAAITTTGALARQIGNQVVSSSRPTNGIYQVDFAQTFSNHICNCNRSNISGSASICEVEFLDSDSLRFRTSDFAGGLVNVNFEFSCFFED